MNTRSVFRAATLVSIALMASRVLGYVREALLASRFGATHTTDAYLTAQDIPSSLFAAISAALVMVFIPVYRDVVQKRGEAAGWRLVSTVTNAVLLLAVGLTALGLLVAPVVVPMLVPGLPQAALDLSVHLTRLMLPMMIFIAAAGVASAVLNANQQFTAPALVGFMSNVAVVTGLLLITSPTQIDWVAWSVVVGAVLSVVIQLPGLPRLGYRYEWRLDWRDPGLHQILRLILPVILTTFAIQLQNFVDRYLASHLAEGSISALNYAVRVNALPYGVIGAAITTVLYPNLAEHVAAGRHEEMRQSVKRGLRTLAFVLLPMAIGLVVFREPIVQLFFQRGAFDPRATDATAYALQFYAVGILFFGWLDFLNRCFFALQDTLTPMWAAVGMVVLNIGFNLALVKPLAHGGLALGTSLATVVAVLYLLWRLQGRMGAVAGLDLLRAVGVNLGTAMAGALCGYITYGALARLFPGASLVHLVVRLGAGLGVVVVVHVGLAVLFGNREVAEAGAGLARKFRRRMP
jgi:putative peptidoglycan lipid II flippase